MVRVSVLIVFLSLLLILLCNFALAQSSGFGLGVIIGEPTGISTKIWLQQNTAISSGAAWSFRGDDSALNIHVDFLLHNFEGSFRTYYGIGGRMKFSDDRRVGIRIPVGAIFLLAKSPVDLFVEIVPLLDLTPKTQFDLGGALGFRFYFLQ